MKKLLVSLACAGLAATGMSVAASAPASAAGDCITIGSWNELTVHCYPSAPGTQYRIVVSCPDGLNWSRWEDQTPWYVDTKITKQCANISLHHIEYR